MKQSEAHIWIGGSSTQNQGGVEENVFGPDATTADIIQKSQQATVIMHNTIGLDMKSKLRKSSLALLSGGE